MLTHYCYMLRYTLMLFPDDCQSAGGPYAGTLLLYAQVYYYVIARLLPEDYMLCTLRCNSLLPKMDCSFNAGNLLLYILCQIIACY